jgi:hypothetical protein
MRVSVWLGVNGRRIVRTMRVLMMLVVHVRVCMIHRLVVMLVLVAFGKV